MSDPALIAEAERTAHWVRRGQNLSRLACIASLSLGVIATLLGDDAATGIFIALAALFMCVAIDIKTTAPTPAPYVRLDVGCAICARRAPEPEQEADRG